MVRNSHDHVHMVLDKNHRHVTCGKVPDQSTEAFDFAVRKARCRLVSWPR